MWPFTKQQPTQQLAEQPSRPEPSILDAAKDRMQSELNYHARAISHYEKIVSDAAHKLEHHQAAHLALSVVIEKMHLPATDDNSDDMGDLLTGFDVPAELVELNAHGFTVKPGNVNYAGPIKEVLPDGSLVMADDPNDAVAAEVAKLQPNDKPKTMSAPVIGNIKRSKVIR